MANAERPEVLTSSATESNRVPTLPAATSPAEEGASPACTAAGYARVTDDPQRLTAKGSRALLADYDGTVVEVLLDCAPSEDDDVYVRIDRESKRRVVAATRLRLLRIVSRHEHSSRETSKAKVRPVDRML